MPRKQTERRKTREWQLSLGRLSLSIKLLPTTKQSRLARLFSKLPNPFLFIFNNKSIFSSALIAAGVSGIVVFAGSLTNPTRPIQPDEIVINSIPVTPASEIKQQNKDLPRSKPVRLKIPAINIDTSVQGVGQNEDKTIQVPSIWDNNAGWYKLGPSPGETGPAVLVGHAGTSLKPLIFWDLPKLKKGDRITVYRKDGTKVVFVINGLQQFDQHNFPTEKVYGNIDYSGLRLITCSGTYDPSVERYDRNTVVYASRVDS